MRTHNLYKILINTNFYRLSDQFSASSKGLYRVHTVQKMCSCPLEAVPKVDIDPSGVFKYILVKVHEKKKDNEESSVVVVRGYKRCNYHSDIYDEVQEKLEPLDCEPLGGGRISHEPDNRKYTSMGTLKGMARQTMKWLLSLSRMHTLNTL